MAKEYIEREALIRKIKYFAADVIFRGCKVIMTEEESCNPVEWTKGYEQGVKDTANLIAGQPAADVVEVVHGRWEPKRKMYRTPNAKNYTCSKCGLPTAERWHYCPNCGARMDGEK